MTITPHLRQHGVTKKFLKAAKTIKCARCGFEFSLMYSRAIACMGCRSSVFGCQFARCPKCDFEFPISQTELASTKPRSKRLARYMSRVLSTYYKDVGEKASR